MRDAICQPFCRYHKPGRREELSCGGLVWREQRPHLAGEVYRLNPLAQAVLFGLSPDDSRLLKVCQGCEYRVDGCNFRDPAVDPADCVPCGGLNAVAGLLAAGRDLGL